MRGRYVFRDGQLVERSTGEPLQVPDGPVARPQMRGDIPAYRSPITGEWITSRSQRREDLARHGCREVDPSEAPSDHYRNERYDRNNWSAERRMRTQ